jgi:hypothetical protein
MKNLLLRPYLSCFALIILIFPSALLAQNEKHTCGFELLEQSRKINIPGKQQRENSLNKAIYSQVLRNSKKQRTDALIPVVVHIIHQNGPENISDAMVIQGIQHLNEAFANTGAFEQTGGVNTNIQFCLAQRDEIGMPTTGITRHVSPLTLLNAETNDAELKAIIQWNPLEYLNVYLVREITSTSLGDGIAGYAFYPSSHGSPEDGIVNEAGLWGSSVDNSKVHIHEAGHYLGLYHTFTEGCTNQNCLLDGDFVCDTPPDNSTNAVNCGSNVNTCTSDDDDLSIQNPFRPVNVGGQGDQPDMHQNYMDYGFQLCQNRFTDGQSERMNAALIGARSSLLSSQGCENACGVAITSILFNNAIILFGSSITLEAIIIGDVPQQYEWIIDGTVVSTDSTYFFYPGNTGVYSVTFRVYNTLLNCYSEGSSTVTVICGSQAGPPTVSNENPQLGQEVTFTGYPNSVSGYQEWYLNGVLVSVFPEFQYTFNEAGENSLIFITGNMFCADTSAEIFIPAGNCNSGQNLRWAFGLNVLMSFYTLGPQISLFETDTFMFPQEGCSNICDANGNLVLFCNGQMAFNGSGSVLANGYDLSGGASAAQATLIVPYPGDDQRFYIFHTDHFGGQFESTGGLSYSIADVELDSIVTKNVFLQTTVTERQAAVKHCNGRDYWHLSQEYGSNKFYAYLVSDTGISAQPVISQVGTISPSEPSGLNAIGCMKISPTGDRLAVTYLSAINNLGFSEVFDFDNTTGVVSNPLFLPNDPSHNYPYGLEFSPDGSKLYISNSDYFEADDIFQYDLSSNNPAEILASKTIIGNTLAPNNGNGSMQLARNGRIYIARTANTFLSEIPFPNLAGPACGLVREAVGNTFQNYGLPNMVSSFSASKKPQIQGPPMLCFNSSADYSVTCGVETNTSWTYTGPGTTTLIDDVTFRIQSDNWGGEGTLIVTRDLGCSGLARDTLVIQIGPPVIDLGSDTVICSTANLQLSPGQGFASYVWQDGSTMSYFNAFEAGTYSVTATAAGGCSVSDEIVITEFTDEETVSLGPDRIWCQQEPVVLFPTPNDFSSYEWSTGESTPEISVNYYGTFILTAIRENGCRAYDTVSVTFDFNNPNFNFTSPQYLCGDSVLVLNTPHPQLAHRWQDNTDLPEFSVWQPGLYWVKVTNGCGFSFTDTVQVLAGENPDLRLGNDTVICPFTPYTISVPQQAGSTYLWQNGSTGNSLLVNSPGLYSVTVVNAQGCSAKDSVLIETCPTSLGLSQVGLSIYPNPANESVYIQSSESSPFMLSVWNTAGQLIEQSTMIISGSYTFDVSHYANGLYFVRVVQGDHVGQYRLEIIHNRN